MRNRAGEEMAGQRRNTASLYDSSASVAVNFVLESSFALALGGNERAPPVAPARGKPTFPVKPHPPADVRRIVAVAAEPRTVTYVVEQQASVDKLAADYIEKRREKVRAQLADWGSPNVNTLPSPPPPPKYKGGAGIIEVAIN